MLIPFDWSFNLGNVVTFVTLILGAAAIAVRRSADIDKALRLAVELEIKTDRAIKEATRCCDEFSDSKDELMKIIDAAKRERDEKIGYIQAGFAAYRETMAERVITRDRLHEIETRFETRINSDLDRFEDRVDKFGARLDALADRMGAPR